MIRKCVFLATAGAVALMILFLPFVYKPPGGKVQELGYSFIGSPRSVNPVGPDIFGTVNIPLLLTEIFGVLYVGSIAYFAVRPKQP